MTLQQLLGIELPIIQAPMAGVQGSALAVAVSNAGGLGSLPCALLSLDAIRGELSAIAAQTAKPINVNFFCHTPPAFDAERDSIWKAALSPYYRAFGIDPETIPDAPGRAPFDAEAAALLSEFKPAVVSFHFGLPSPELLAEVKRAGSQILSSATTVDEAVWLETHGADAIIAQGLEAGGHRGMFLSEELTTQVGTLALVPQIVEKVRIPVIAAGGIADARGVAAAMALGAAGVQVGTAYLLCEEATTSALHRAALKSEAARHTAVTNLFTGRPARGIVNRIMRELGPISDASPAFPLAVSAMAPLRAHAESRGSDDFTPLWSGQNNRGCKEISAGALTRELAGDL
jgi:nitronate monooxygenase